MKRKIVIGFGVLVIFVSIGWLVKSFNRQTIVLSPEIKEILKIPPIDKSKMDNNAFIGLVAIDAPADEDPMEIGKKYVVEWLEKYQQAINKQDFQILYNILRNPRIYYKEKPISIANPTSYRFGCAYLTNTDCIKEIMAKQAEINQLIINNKVVYNRYKAYIKLPDYNSYVSFITLPLDFSTNYIWLSRLHLQEAILAIENNEIDRGLDILQAELHFARRSLAADTGISAFDLIVYKSELRTIYHIINSLLDSPTMAKQLYHPKLLALLQPFTKEEQQILVKVLTCQRNYYLQLLYILANEDFNIEDLHVVKRTEFNQLKKNNTALLFDRAKTMQLFYERMTDYIELAKRVLPASAKAYQQTIKPQLEITPLTLEQIKNKYGTTNILGQKMIQDRTKGMFTYFLRFYDVISYSVLIEAKLKIKQANLKKEQVAEFLIKHKDQLMNPYTGEPYMWNEQQQTLTTDWLDHSIDNESHGEKASVNIKFID